MKAWTLDRNWLSTLGSGRLNCWIHMGEVTERFPGSVWTLRREKHLQTSSPFPWSDSLYYSRHNDRSTSTAVLIYKLKCQTPAIREEPSEYANCTWVTQLALLWRGRELFLPNNPVHPVCLLPPNGACGQPHMDRDSRERSRKLISM
jgi:hypothetical protein